MSELIEAIEKALNQEIPVEWHRNGPEWLRALLEDNKNLKQELSHVSTALSLSRVDAKRFREEAMNERKLSEGIVGEREALIIENGKLRECLEWYADKDNFDWHEVGDVPIMQDEGERARTIISQLEGESK